MAPSARSAPVRSTRRRNEDVIVVGAGPAGIGIGCAFREFGVKKVAILDREAIGASFRRWPAEMRLITPSFTSNAFGLLDLNAVVAHTSPAYSLDAEHPSGRAYAEYLETVANHYSLAVETGIDVQSVAPDKDGFTVHTDQGPRRARFVVWAAGEFQYPDRLPFPGAEHCMHSADVRSWADLPGDAFTVIGGYESGLDAAVTLARRQRSVTVLSAEASWDNDSPDPSISLSPFTRERLEVAADYGLIDLVGDARIARVIADGTRYELQAEDGRTWCSPTAPLLCTGFSGSASLLQGLVETDDEGSVIVTEEADESTLVPGLFLAGPMVQHRGVRFCFIYKYRQRFAVVADTIAGRLGLNTTEAVEDARHDNMYLDDLSCCEESCAC